MEQDFGPGSQYDKVLYLIEDNEISLKAIEKYIKVWHYPDGRKELRLNGAALPYSTYDRLSEIDQGVIVDNKRLGRTLEYIKLVQDKRDNNHSQAIPAGAGSSRRRRKPTESICGRTSQQYFELPPAGRFLNRKYYNVACCYVCSASVPISG
jgi:hypothetical protein